jgi:hypothetical protein
MSSRESFRSRALDFLERAFASAGKGLQAEAWPSDALDWPTESASPRSHVKDEPTDRTGREEQPVSANDDAR